MINDRFGYIVVFHSKWHPSWCVISLQKFWFQQAPDLNMTSKYFQQIRVKFVLEAWNLSFETWMNILSAYACKNHRQASGFLFTFLIHFFEFSDGFGTLPKFVLPVLHFGKFECCVMCYCQIEWNTTVMQIKGIVDNNRKSNKGPPVCTKCCFPTEVSIPPQPFPNNFNIAIPAKFHHCLPLTPKF